MPTAVSEVSKSPSTGVNAWRQRQNLDSSKSNFVVREFVPSRVFSYRNLLREMPLAPPATRLETIPA